MKTFFFERINLATAALFRSLHPAPTPLLFQSIESTVGAWKGEERRSALDLLDNSHSGDPISLANTKTWGLRHFASRAVVVGWKTSWHSGHCPLCKSPTEQMWRKRKLRLGESSTCITPGLHTWMPPYDSTITQWRYVLPWDRLRVCVVAGLYKHRPTEFHQTCWRGVARPKEKLF